MLTSDIILVFIVLVSSLVYFFIFFSLFLGQLFPLIFKPNINNMLTSPSLLLHYITTAPQLLIHSLLLFDLV